MSSTFPVLSYFSVIIYLASFTLAQSPPQLNLSNTNEQQIIRPGVTTTLECPVRNSKGIIFEWYKDNEYIMTYGGQRLRILANGSLKIKETNFDDTGVYRCRAVNGFGSVEFNTTLLVIGNDEDYDQYGDMFDTEDVDSDESKISLTAKPRLLFVTKEESPVYRQPGSTFRLQCVATGYPKPEMMWYKDGIQVSRVFRIGRWALKFTKALSTDSGNYTCVATNVLGTASHSWILVVDDKKISSMGRPFLTGKNTTAEEGERVIMECGVKSDSFPHIEWLKQVDPSDRDPNEPRMDIPMDGEYFNVLTKPYTVDYMVKDGMYYHKLVIENVQTTDAGKYVCLGANSFGYEYRFSFLEVIPKNPGFQSSLPFPIIVTATVVGIAALGCVLALLLYCRPRRRSGSRGSSTGVPMVTKEDFIPMHPGSSVATRCGSKQCKGKMDHQVVYVAGHSNGMV